MRSRLAWFLAGAGLIGGLIRFLRRPHTPSVSAPAADSRAEELRRRLEESRSLVEEREEFESGETTVDQAEPPPADPADRRRAIHEHGRAAAEEMRSDPRS